MGYLATDQAMNTNDPQAPYTVKLNGPIEAATAPLLSDEELAAITKRYPEVNGDTSTAYEAGDEIRDWYEAKIASGELMSRSDALLRHLIEVLDENPMIEDTYPRMTELRAKIIEAETK